MVHIWYLFFVLFGLSVYSYGRGLANRDERSFVRILYTPCCETHTITGTARALDSWV